VGKGREPMHTHKHGTPSTNQENFVIFGCGEGKESWKIKPMHFTQEFTFRYQSVYLNIGSVHRKRVKKKQFAQCKHPDKNNFEKGEKIRRH
jgi:hypothetical protein